VVGFGKMVDSASELTQLLVASQSQVERSFRLQVKKESVLKRDKLKNMDQQLHAARQSGDSSQPSSRQGPQSMATPRSKSGRDPVTLVRGSPSPMTSQAVGVDMRVCRAHSRTQTASSPDLVRRERSAEWGPQGIARSRLGVSSSLMQHPAVHPGAHIRLGDVANEAAVHKVQQHAVLQGLPGSPAASRRTVSQCTMQTPGSRAASPARFPEQSRLASVKAELTRLQATSPTPVEDEEVLEENLELALDTLCAEHKLASVSGQLYRRPSKDVEAIGRLAKLKTMLGPRYRTVNKDMIWDRAQHGFQSRFHRDIRKNAERGIKPENPVSAFQVIDANAALEAIAPDVESDARLSWLRSRKMTKSLGLGNALEGLTGAGMTEDPEDMGMFGL